MLLYSHHKILLLVKMSGEFSAKDQLFAIVPLISIKIIEKKVFLMMNIDLKKNENVL